MIKILFSILRISSLVLIGSLLYISCATDIKPRLSPKHEGIHTEFQPYIQDFINISDGILDYRDVKKLSVAFSEQEGNTVGVCWNALVWKEIEVDNFFWKFASPLRKKALIYHELGHCLLHRGHDNESEGFYAFLEKLGIYTPKVKEFSDGCPKTIMVTHMLSEKCLQRHMPHYEKELFKGLEKKRYSRVKDDIHKQICKDIEVINKTDTWNERDAQSLRSAARTCDKKYKSCLKVFFKNKEREYGAICR